VRKQLVASGFVAYMPAAWDQQWSVTFHARTGGWTVWDIRLSDDGDSEMDESFSRIDRAVDWVASEIEEHGGALEDLTVRDLDPQDHVELRRFVARLRARLAPQMPAVEYDLEEWDGVRSEGLDAIRKEPCVACREPTDTVFCVFGVGLFHSDFLGWLGLRMTEAIGIVEDHIDSAKPAPIGWQEWYENFYRTCRECASKAGYPEPGLAIVGRPVPTMTQPEGPWPRTREDEHR
jgi:hypothetical protein